MNLCRNQNCFQHTLSQSTYLGESCIMRDRQTDARQTVTHNDLFIFKKHGDKYTVEPLLRGHPDERPTPLERPLDNVNLNINVLISTPDERPPLLKGHFPGAKGVASQEGFHCII